MRRWTNESTGMDVLRPVAKKALEKNFELKSRIWSGTLEAWGFFSELSTDYDTFLLWCSAVPGDRLLFEVDNKMEICTIVAMWKERDTTSWKMRLMTSGCQLIDISTEEHKLFGSAWNASQF